MITNGPQSDTITVAETTRHSWEEEESRQMRAHDLKVRELELSYLKQDQNIGTLLRIPLTIIKLPLYCILAVGFCIAMIQKHNPEQSFWDLLN